MNKTNKFTHAVLLGVFSSSLQAAEDVQQYLNKSKPVNPVENQNNTNLKNLIKLVLVNGVKTWITDDQAINNLDLEPIKYKLVVEDNDTGMTMAEADELGEKYRAFLYLSKKYPDKNIVPSKEVDIFWHAHILDTYKYQIDSENIFGRFFHHYPYFGMKDVADKQNLETSFNETVELYRNEFPSKISNKMIAREALCIGEAKPKKSLQGSALCIGEAKPLLNSAPELSNQKNVSFEQRGRPRLDRLTGEVIFS